MKAILLLVLALGVGGRYHWPDEPIYKWSNEAQYDWPEEVKEEPPSTVLLYYFGAKWCSGCNVGKALLKSDLVPRELANRIRVVDIDERKDLADWFGVTDKPIPVFMLVEEDGMKPIKRMDPDHETWNAKSFVLSGLQMYSSYTQNEGSGIISELPADSQPTPMAGVMAMLQRLDPQPDEVLIDPGCGFDARILVAACRHYGTKKAIGIEIVPELAESARQHVAGAGLSDRITIITGDSTKIDWQADIGAAYLWPETLEQMAPRIKKLKRFVSFGFSTPKLPSQAKTTDAGTTYLWKSTPLAIVPAPIVRHPVRVPIVRTVNSGIINLPRGSWCQVCGSYCSNPMAHRLQQQVVGYRNGF